MDDLNDIFSVDDNSLAATSNVDQNEQEMLQMTENLHGDTSTRVVSSFTSTDFDNDEYAAAIQNSQIALNPDETPCDQGQYSCMVKDGLSTALYLSNENQEIFNNQTNDVQPANSWESSTGTNPLEFLYSTLNVKSEDKRLMSSRELNGDDGDESDEYDVGSAGVTFGMAGVSDSNISPEEADMRNRFAHAILRGNGRDATIIENDRRRDMNMGRRQIYHAKRKSWACLTEECKQLFIINMATSERGMYELGDINDTYLLQCCNLAEENFIDVPIAITMSTGEEGVEALSTSMIVPVTVDDNTMAMTGDSHTAKRRKHSILPNGKQCAGKDGHRSVAKGSAAYHYQCNPIYGKAVMWVLLNLYPPLSIRTCLKNGKRIYALATCPPTILTYGKLWLTIQNRERTVFCPFVRNVSPKTSELEFPEITPIFSGAIVEPSVTDGAKFLTYQTELIIGGTAFVCLRRFLERVWHPVLISAFPAWTTVSPPVINILKNCGDDPVRYVEFLTSRALVPLEANRKNQIDYILYSRNKLCTFANDFDGAIFVAIIDNIAGKDGVLSERDFIFNQLRLKLGYAFKAQLKLASCCKLFLYSKHNELIHINLGNCENDEQSTNQALMPSTLQQNCETTVAVIWVRCGTLDSVVHRYESGEMKQILIVPYV